MNNSNNNIAATSGTGQERNTTIPPNDNARSRLPQQLINAKRWMLYKLDYFARHPNEKPRKVPHYVSGFQRAGTLDSPEDVSKFGTFDEALDAFVASGEYEGIAFALGPDGTGNHWQGIDLDDVPTNQLSDLANALPGYVEMSPSGKGAHAIGYGREFTSLGSNRTGIEAYAGKRFFTFTGNAIRNAPAQCLADFVHQQLAPRHRAQSNANAVTATWVPANVVQELRYALAHMRSDDRGLWVSMGQALHELGETGRGLWIEWSLTSDKWKPTDAKTWDTFRGDRTGYQAVFAAAQARGWINPNSNAARIRETTAATTGEFTFKFAKAGDPVVQVEYMIDPWIPIREVIGCYGRGEAGKSSWSAQAAANVSGSHSTLWISSEEQESHIRARHLGCGGENGTLAVKCGHPKKIDPVTGKAISTSFNVYDHLEPAIEAFRRDPEARADRPLGLVVLDAVVALVTWGKGESANDDAGVKRLMANLLDVCVRQNVTILALGHLNKGNKSEHLADAVMGSASWTNSVRLAYMFVKDYTADFQGFVRTVKANTGAPFGALYRTVPVRTLKLRDDGHANVLCGVVMEETLWGETALREAIADEDDSYLQGLEKKKAKVDAIVDAVMRQLKIGPTTRQVVDSFLGKQSRRHWLDADNVLVQQGVQIHPGRHNTKSYSLKIDE